ncbi:galactokinase [Bachmanniomyces sp. S44760]|nr:galactokinase [Bachmanniomyces sp. S44760]
MDQPVPVTRNLADVYNADALAKEKARWIHLEDRFEDLYDHPPQFVARSPGRVNIIGEHIDYSLYEVLPMAITADVIIAVSWSKADVQQKVEIANTNNEKFKLMNFEITHEGEHVYIDPSAHEWTNYFKSGLRGAITFLKKRNPEFRPVSMQVLVDGTVPSGGGLSSSAALVSASALAVLHANDPKSAILKKDLVELAIVSERAVGVNSGGMDQSASVASIRDHALSVSFSPYLHAEAIAFPKLDTAINFLIAQSYVQSDKHVTAPQCYNLRVVECTLAAEYIAAKLNLKLEKDSGPLGTSLRGLQTAYFSKNSIDKKSSTASPTSSESTTTKHEHEIADLSEMIALVATHLPSTSGYTRAEIASVLHTTVPSLEEKYMTKFPVRADKFQLRNRALHVLNESIRVSKFKSLLLSPPPPSEGNLLEKLGDLLNETQSSCRDVYDCSCPELDELCDIARRNGACGSRLTGAGWGGCSVHLVPKDKVAEVTRAWEREYYGKRFPNMSKEKLDAAIVNSEAGVGAIMSVCA